jgi:hypothetical protein
MLISIYKNVKGQCEILRNYTNGALHMLPSYLHDFRTNPFINDSRVSYVVTS